MINQVPVLLQAQRISARQKTVSQRFRKCAKWHLSTIPNERSLITSKRYSLRTGHGKACDKDCRKCKGPRNETGTQTVVAARLECVSMHYSCLSEVSPQGCYGSKVLEVCLSVIYLKSKSLTYLFMSKPSFTSSI